MWWGGGIRLVRFEIGWLRICERFIFDDGGRVDGGAAKNILALNEFF